MRTALTWGGARIRGRRLVGRAVLALHLLSFAGVAGAAEPELAPIIAQTLADPAPLNVAGVRLDAAALRALYDTRSSAPLWASQPDVDARIDAVLGVLRQADLEGLDPQAYRIAQIEARRGATDPLARAELDLLLSEAVMRYGVHVRTGARRPRVAIPELPPMVVDPDPVPIALEVAAAPPSGVAAAMAKLPPQTESYAALRALLTEYRAIAARGGWPTVGEGPKLEPGAVDPSVRRVRDHLQAIGELPADGHGASRRDHYDDRLVDAVKKYQRRHGLAADGTIGPRTRAAMNVTAAERAVQIAANLERLRWLPTDLGERYVWINIPEYTLRVEDRGTTMLEMPVIVGRDKWQTPVFSSEIQQLVFNPPWNVPPRIAAEEVIPRGMADPGYFAAQGISVRGGTRVASAGSGIADGGMPVKTTPRRLRQAPGPKNPLGRVKFNMPNPFGVYLHDTPNKDKFRLGTRSLSHGCVRVGSAPTLAAALLGDMPEWDEARRKKALSDWNTRSVELRSPVPVHLVYATAWRAADGSVQFREDIYDSDAQLVRDLAKPRSVRPVTGAPPPAGDTAPAPVMAAAP